MSELECDVESEKHENILINHGSEKTDKNHNYIGTPPYVGSPTVESQGRSFTFSGGPSMMTSAAGDERARSFDFIEVPAETRVKKKSTTMESMRQFLRENIMIVTETLTENSYYTGYSKQQSLNSDSATSTRKGSDNEGGGSDNVDFVPIKEIKETPKMKKKKMKESKYSKRKKRALAIQNEGASLWSPREECCWKSAANRVVRLEDTNIHQLCEAERETLKTLALQKLAEEGFSNITLPKDKRVSPSRRWKQLLPLIRNSKGVPEQKSAEEKVRNPVFSVDLCQAIENEKNEERTTEEHEITIAKLDAQIRRDSNDNDKPSPPKTENTFPKSYYGKRSSDPLINRYCLTNGEKPVVSLDNLIPPTQSAGERDPSNHRVSRLIEALSLSSTTASSMCVLDRDQEFKPTTSQVPKVMKCTTDFIIKHGLHTVHIFRSEGSKKRVKKMREDFDNGVTGVITDSSNPLDVAALLKDFIRNLPEPLLTRELYNAFISLGKLNDEEEYNKFLKFLVWLLPVPNRDTLEVVLKCLKLVAENSADKYDENGNIVTQGNKMDSKSIATIMAPNVLYRYKGYKTNNPYQIDEENKVTIDAFHALISLTDQLFVIEKEIHDEVLKRLLETDPETVDYVLRKKSTRASLVEVLKNSDDDATPTLKRPQSLSLAKQMSHNENEGEVKKAHSFTHGKSATPVIPKRRHLSTVTRPEINKLDSPDRGGFSKFHRGSRLRRSLGSREFKGSRTAPKSGGSPCSSPFSSKRSINDKRKDRNNSADNSTASINEHQSSYHIELPGVFLGVGGAAGRNQPLQNSTSFSSTTDSETGSKGESIDETSDSVPEISCNEAPASPRPPDKVKKLLPAKMRKISLPAFLHSNSSDRSIFRSHGKSSSVETEERNSPVRPASPGDENVFESIKEASDTEFTAADTSDKKYVDSRMKGSDKSRDKSSTRRRTLMESLNQRDDPKSRDFIDWNKKEDWPEWQLQVIASGLSPSPETTL